MDLKATFQQAQNQRLSGSPVLGIDVYHGDGPINWPSVAASGHLFAWLKASEGQDLQDELFHTNRDQCHAGGIIPGAYHFFRPKTAGQKQIDNFLSMVGSMQGGELPPALDLEVPKDWKVMSPSDLAAAQAQHRADWMSIAMEDRIQRVLQWLEAVEQALGVRPIIYTGPSFVEEILGNDPRLAKYLLWVAHYNVATPTVPAPWTGYTWWQFSDQGTISGATSHPLDVDRFEGSLADLKALCFQGIIAPPSAVTVAWYERCWLFRWLRSLWSW